MRRQGKIIRSALLAAVVVIVMLILPLQSLLSAARFASVRPLCPPDCTVLEQKFGVVNLGGVPEHEAPITLGNYQFQLSDLLDSLYSGTDFLAANLFLNQLVITFSEEASVSEYPKSVRVGIASYLSGPTKVTGKTLRYEVNDGETLEFVTTESNSFLQINDPAGIRKIVIHNIEKDDLNPTVWAGLEYIQIPEINKIMPDEPSAPVVDSKSTDTVTLVQIDNAEYSMDGTHWQASPIFTGLVPGSEYTFFARYLEALNFASMASPGTTGLLDKLFQSPPGAPEVLAKTADSVTLQTIEGAEYSIDGTIWQTSPVFSGLTPATDYTFFARYSETDTIYVTEVSAGTLVRTEKISQATPAAPVILSLTSDSVTLTDFEGAEYSIDGTIWQTSPVFSELNPATSYTFFARYAETDTAFASAASSGAEARTDRRTQAAPAVPGIISTTSDSITVAVIEGAEYSLDGINWQASPDFFGLTPATDYTIYIRYAADAESYASDSTALAVRTRDITQSAPLVPQTGEYSSNHPIITLLFTVAVSSVLFVATCSIRKKKIQ